MAASKKKSKRSKKKITTKGWMLSSKERGAKSKPKKDFFPPKEFTISQY